MNHLNTVERYAGGICEDDANLESHAGIHMRLYLSKTTCSPFESRLSKSGPTNYSYQQTQTDVGDPVKTPESNNPATVKETDGYHEEVVEKNTKTILCLLHEKQANISQ